MSTVTTYQRILKKLLPFGAAWRELNATFNLLLEAFAAEASRIHNSIEALVVESNPAQAVSFLSDYESFALADDEKPTGSETTTQRRQVLGAKMRTAYTGPSKSFFVGIGTKLGMTITVSDGTELTGDDVARVEEALVDFDRVTDSGDGLRWVVHVVSDPNSQLAKLRAMIARIKPAHTEVTYT